MKFKFVDFCLTFKTYNGELLTVNTKSVKDYIIQGIINQKNRFEIDGGMIMQIERNDFDRKITTKVFNRDNPKMFAIASFYLLHKTYTIWGYKEQGDKQIFEQIAYASNLEDCLKTVEALEIKNPFQIITSFELV